MIEVEILECKICGNSAGNTAYTAREMMYGLRDEFAYFQCSNCECLQIKDIPQNMERYYPSQYYSFNEYDGRKFSGLWGSLKKYQYKAAVFHKGMLQKCFNFFLDVPDYRIFKGLNVGFSTRILDVGCGNARSFLYPLATIGFQNTLGCDPFIAAEIAYTNGLKVKQSTVFEIGGEWDIVTYHHSFEHVADPQENLNHIASILDKNGVCIIRIPTASSWAWEHYRTNWAQLDAPRHFFLHSRESMRLMAEKAGLELYDIIDDSRHFQFSGSEKYVADTALAVPRKKGLFRFLNRKWKKWEYIRRAKDLNAKGEGDQAAFFLRRKATN